MSTDLLNGNWLHVTPSPPEGYLWWCSQPECMPLVGAPAGCGYEPTVAAASDAARAHAINSCPANQRATERLLADVLAVPDFRPATFRPHYSASFCLRCGRLAINLGEHVDGHLEAITHG